jgi:predicted kinase
VTSTAPFIVVVSGLPATGKSTLSSRLGRDLAVPVVSRDRLRLAVFADLEESPIARQLMAAAATRLVTEVLSSIFDAGGGAVFDGNFNRPDHADGLAELLAERRARTVEVCLWGDADALTARFVERADPPLTPELRPYFDEVMRRRREPVLPDAEFVAEFDTTEFALLDRSYSGLLARIRRLLATS